MKAPTAVDIFVLVLSIVPQVTWASSEVCYDVVGCFTSDPPFDNAYGRLPQSPDVIKPEFELYTPGDEQPFLLDYRDPKVTGDTLKLDPSLPTKFIIHGFGNSLNETIWIADMRKALQEKGDYNVVLVGWNTGAPNYLQAVANTRLVGRLVVRVIDMLQAKGVDLSNVHLIGHSLGAHISSYAGHKMQGKVSRITGLDPAGPGFKSLDAAVKLDPSDAQFVDVIHSNGHVLSAFGGFGLSRPVGHVDFYPNGGERQPGCYDGLPGGAGALLEHLFQGKSEGVEEDVLDAVGCSHGRAYEIFIESIQEQTCRFKAFPCKSFDDFVWGNCDKCGPKGCNFAGFHASPSSEGGKQYFLTNGASPFCSYSYLVTIVPAEDGNKLSGTIALALFSSRKKVGVIVGHGPLNMEQSVPWKAVVDTREDVGDLLRMVVIYNRDSFFSRKQIGVSKLTIQPLFNQKRYTSTSAFQMKTGSQRHLELKEDTH